MEEAVILESILQESSRTNTYLEFFIVLVGIIIAFIVAGWFYKAFVKPLLRTYLKLNI